MCSPLMKSNGWYCLLGAIASLAAIFLLLIIHLGLYRGTQYWRDTWRESFRLLQIPFSRDHTLPARHATALCLKELIDEDGAGSWPPRAKYGNAWPPSLQPFHHIYLEVVPFLSSQDVTTEIAISIERCINFRVTMTKLLCERVNLDMVRSTLADEGQSKLNGDVWNGFFACIACLRHAFRWGTIPIVKSAQEELWVEFPIELNTPWRFLQERYGIDSSGGNITSNYLCNFDDREQLVYPVNSGMPAIITSTEYHFAHIFPAVEAQALEIYYLVVQCYSERLIGDLNAVLATVIRINVLVRDVLKSYFETMIEEKVSKVVWMQYTQGFQGWGLQTIDALTGEHVKYEGLSGNQLLFFQVIDAFLGLEPYLSADESLRYMPRRQRMFRDSVRQHSFRSAISEPLSKEIEDELLGIAKQMRLFRSAHKSRVLPYLAKSAPERMIMTAGKGVLETELRKDIEGSIAPLVEMLMKRLKETK